MKPNHFKRYGMLISFVLLVAACASQQETLTVDLRTQSGVYVVGYSNDLEIRTAFEDQLVDDLNRLEIRAIPSHRDLDEIFPSSAREVLNFATSHKLLAIVVVNQAGNPAVDELNRATSEHPTIKKFFEEMDHELNDVRHQDVIVEVNGYLIDEHDASHIWSGVSAVFDVNERRSAITSLSQSVAQALKAAQSRVRPSRE